MPMLRARHTLASLSLPALALLSCVAGPPHVPPSGTLGPASYGAAPPSRAVFAVVFAGPRGRVLDREQPAVTVLFNRAMREPDAIETAGLPAAILTADGD